MLCGLLSVLIMLIDHVLGGLNWWRLVLLIVALYRGSLLISLEWSFFFIGFIFHIRITVSLFRHLMITTFIRHRSAMVLETVCLIFKDAEPFRYLIRSHILFILNLGWLFHLGHTYWVFNCKVCRFSTTATNNVLSHIRKGPPLNTNSGLAFLISLLPCPSGANLLTFLPVIHTWILRAAPKFFVSHLIDIREVLVKLAWEWFLWLTKA